VAPPDWVRGGALERAGNGAALPALGQSGSAGHKAVEPPGRRRPAV